MQTGGHAYAALGPAARAILSCGYWDNSIKVHASDDGRLLQSIAHHKDVVTAVAVSMSTANIMQVVMCA